MTYQAKAMCIKEFDGFRPGTVYDIEISLTEGDDFGIPLSPKVSVENKKVSWEEYKNHFQQIRLESVL
jgi:hypothetical protein